MVGLDKRLVDGKLKHNNVLGQGWKCNFGRQWVDIKLQCTNQLSKFLIKAQSRYKLALQLSKQSKQNQSLHIELLNQLYPINLMQNQMNESRTSSHYSQKPHHNRNHQSSFRLDPVQIQHQIRSLQDQIQFTVCNYESILQTQKKNTSQRNEFLLYLIQSMKQKHNQQIQKYQQQLQTTFQQKQQASSLQTQMKNIGEGVDSILQEGNRLKEVNFALLKELDQQNQREKEIDDQIESHNKEIQYLRDQVQQ